MGIVCRKKTYQHGVEYEYRRKIKEQSHQLQRTTGGTAMLMTVAATMKDRVGDLQQRTQTRTMKTRVEAWEQIVVVYGGKLEAKQVRYE